MVDLLFLLPGDIRIEPGGTLATLVSVAVAIKFEPRQHLVDPAGLFTSYRNTAPTVRSYIGLFGCLQAQRNHARTKENARFDVE
jgi:hypothetical protein